MQNRSVVAIAMVSFFLLTPLLFSENSPEHADQLLSLSSLNPRCRLEKKWFGLVPALPEAIWLTCGNESFLVTGPNNLVDHVVITNERQALEYVRFFTSADSYRFFDLNGNVELFPGVATQKSTFNIVDEKFFKTHFQAADVSEISSQKGSRFAKQFAIVRVVVSLDQKIYQINEFVTENGFYSIENKKILFNDATKLGIVHLGDI